MAEYRIPVITPKQHPHWKIVFAVDAEGNVSMWDYAEQPPPAELTMKPYWVLDYYNAHNGENPERPDEVVKWLAETGRIVPGPNGMKAA